MQLSPIGKGGNSLPGMTAGQLHENRFSSTILVIMVLAGQSRTWQTPSTRGYQSQINIKMAAVSIIQSCFPSLSSRITSTFCALKDARGDTAPIFTLRAIYHDFPRSWPSSSASPQKQSCNPHSPHSPPPWFPSPSPAEARACSPTLTTLTCTASASSPPTTPRANRSSST